MKNRLSENPKNIVSFRTDDLFEQKVQEYMSTGRYLSRSELMYDALFTMVLHKKRDGAPTAIEELFGHRQSVREATV
jgi:Arc/MetJ-type ribon-helix-helix transcriptional regulator